MYNPYTYQPGPVIQWMPKPEAPADCPYGLEYLSAMDMLNVQQVPSITEAVTGFEMNNKYGILNAAGQQAYFAAEDTGVCMRMCCGSQRGFKIHIFDNQNQLVMDVNREFKCCSGCCWCAGCCPSCCAHELEIQAPIGNPAGFVKQIGSCWKARFEVSDQYNNPLQIINGPCCVFDGPCMPCDNTFKIMDNNEEVELGSLKKEYAGFIKEAFTNADKFSIKFPEEISPANKGSLLAAMFLIDFMFFEQKNNQDQGRRNNMYFD